MTTIERLKVLEQAATPGPWTESGRDVDHDKFVAAGRNPGDACGLGCEIDGPPEASLRGQFHRHADAALIAEARNMLPALFALVEAAHGAMRLAYAVPGAFPDDTNHVPDDQVSVTLRRDRVAARALREALAALENLP
jgi:hypothetical protein